jgi:hypothetical protein
MSRRQLYLVSEVASLIRRNKFKTVNQGLCDVWKRSHFGSYLAAVGRQKILAEEALVIKQAKLKSKTKKSNQPIIIKPKPKQTLVASQELKICLESAIQASDQDLEIHVSKTLEVLKEQYIDQCQTEHAKSVVIRKTKQGRPLSAAAPSYIQSQINRNNTHVHLGNSPTLDLNTISIIDHQNVIPPEALILHSEITAEVSSPSSTLTSITEPVLEPEPKVIESQVEIQAEIQEQEQAQEQEQEHHDPDEEVFHRMAEQIMNEINTNRGKRSESQIIKLLEQRRNCTVTDNNRKMYYKTLGTGDDIFVIGGRIDGLVNGKLIEIKKRQRGFLPYARDSEVIQVYCYMYLLGLKEGEIIEEFNGEIRHYIIKFDLRFWKRIVTALSKFHKQYMIFLTSESRQQWVLNRLDKNDALIF